MPRESLSFPSIRIALAVAGVSALSLAGCATTGKTVDTSADRPQAQTAKPDSAKGLLAKGGTTASNLYVEPVISKAPQPGAEQAEASAPSVPEIALQETADPTQPASIAGLATQPTGVRAGSGTIFSSAPPAPSVEPSAQGPVPADLPRRNFNATTASLFGAPTAPAAPSCGTDEQGNPLSC